MRAASSGLLKRKRILRGAAVVEFALVVPLFVLLFFGMIELGRGVMVMHILEGAARIGAREAMFESASSKTVQAAVDEYLKNSSVSGVKVTVDPSPSSVKSREPVTVTVSIPITKISWIGTSRFLADSKDISASATMRKEGPAKQSKTK